MKCDTCGVDNAADAAYCSKCGTPLADAGAGQATATQRFLETAKSRQEQTSEDEQELWSGGYSAKAMYGTWLLAGLGSIGLIVAMFFFPVAMVPLALAMFSVWIVLGLILGYKKLAVHYTLTTQRFLHRLGILKIVTDRVEVIDIDDVTYEQGLIQRLLNVGTIRISSSDRTHPELVLSGISDVQKVADQIDDVRRKERRRRGLHIETV